MEEIVKQEIDMIMWEVHPEEEVSTARYHQIRSDIEKILIDEDVANEAFLKKLDKCQFYWYVFGVTHS